MNTKITFSVVCSLILLFVLFGFNPAVINAQNMACPADAVCMFSDPSVGEQSNTVPTANTIPASNTVIPPTSSYTPTSSYYTPINQVTTGSCQKFTQTLRLGNNGTAVSTLQTWLMNKGYVIASIASGKNQTGYYGYETYTALGKYQKAVGIRVTGVLDTATMSKMNSSCNSVVNTNTLQTGSNLTGQVNTATQTQAEKDAAIQAAIQTAVAQYRASGGR